MFEKLISHTRISESQMRLLTVITFILKPTNRGHPLVQQLRGENFKAVGVASGLQYCVIVPRPGIDLIT